MRPGRWPFALLLAVSPGPALALDALCRFAIECVEAEPCAATDYALRVMPQDSVPPTALLQDQAESVEATLGALPDGTTWAMAAGAGVLRLLTVAPGGDARYTLHLAAPMALSYLGRCENP